jgi:hypothetical protein
MLSSDMGSSDGIFLLSFKYIIPKSGYQVNNRNLIEWKENDEAGLGP